MINLKKYTFIFAFAFAIAITSCDSQGTKVESISGSYTYTLASQGEGNPVANGDYLILSLKAVDNTDSVWFERNASENPIAILKDSAKWASGTDGVNEIFYNARKGDSLVIELTIQDFFSNTAKAPVPEGVTAESLTMYWKVVEIMDYKGFYDYMMALEEKMNSERTELEAGTIEEFINQNGWTVSSTSPGGVRVIVHEEGEGPIAESGQKVEVIYAGYFLSGELFDTNNEELAKEEGVFMEGRPYDALSFVIDQGPVIQGWHQAFQLMNKGTKATIIIPSAQGYGPNGYPPVIPGNSILRFDVELLDIE